MTTGIEPRLPPRSPNLNAHAERFVRSIKESCLDRMILFGETSLKTAIRNFVAHYHSKETTKGWPIESFFPRRVTSERAVLYRGGSDWAAC